MQIYNEERRRFSLVRNQPRKIVEKVASDIEKLLAKKRKALDVSISARNTDCDVSSAAYFFSLQFQFHLTLYDIHTHLSHFSYFSLNNKTLTEKYLI